MKRRERRRMRQRQRVMRVLVIVGLLLAAISLPSLAQEERIKDLASIAGVRSNGLMGYGLVVGLDGSGDQTSQSPFTVQALRNLLTQLGVTIPPGVNPQLKNAAAVMVQAELPAFARPGQQIGGNQKLADIHKAAGRFGRFGHNLIESHFIGDGACNHGNLHRVIGGERIAAIDHRQQGPYKLQLPLQVMIRPRPPLHSPQRLPVNRTATKTSRQRLQTNQTATKESRQPLQTNQ